MPEFSRTSRETRRNMEAPLHEPSSAHRPRVDLALRTEPAVGTRDGSPTRPGLELGHVPRVVCAMGIGLLLCSGADALSRSTLLAPSVIFWAGILLIVGPPFVRLVSAEPSTSERLALVCLLGLALYGVKYLQNPFVYTYSDELAHQYNVQQIVQHHHLFNSNPLLPITARYPGLEGATSALIELTGMSSFAAGLLLIAAARVVLMIGLFLLFTRISASPRVGGVGAAIYTANSNFLFFAAQFSYESLALPLLVAVLVLVAERGTRSRGLTAAWTVPIALGIGAVVVTHHVTAYALTITLASLAVIHGVMRRRARSPWPFAALAAVLTVGWLLLVASITISYLTPVFGHAFSATVHTIAGESKPRRLFSGAGPSAPPIERVIAVSSVALLGIGLPLGLWQVWRHHRGEPFAWLMSLAAVAVFATFPLRFAPAAWETAERAAEFLFVGLAFVLACIAMPVDHPIGRAPPWLGRMLLTACFAVVSVGGIISGWPSSMRLAQPTRIDAGGQVIDSERLALAHWTASHVPAQRFIANETDARALMDYGRASVALSGADYDEVIRSPRLAPWQLAIVRDDRVRYVISDAHVSPTLFFSVPGVGASLVPPSAISKFELVPAAPIFDSGQIIIYDMNDRP